MSRILVIDPDEPNRTLVREWLCAEGYDVVELARAQDGGPVPVDVVLLDLPRLRPLMLACVREARALCPQAAIIGLSTQAPRSLSGGSALAGALGLRKLLGKPSSRHELQQAVRSALGRTA